MLEQKGGWVVDMSNQLISFRALMKKRFSLEERSFIWYFGLKTSDWDTLSIGKPKLV